MVGGDTLVMHNIGRLSLHAKDKHDLQTDLSLFFSKLNRVLIDIKYMVHIF